MSDWRHEAACLEVDPELFFPIGNTGPALLQIEEAKAVCRRCDVVETCLRWALDTGQDSGVWGGLSEEERLGLRDAERAARRADLRASRKAAPPAPRPEPKPVTSWRGLVPSSSVQSVIVAAREAGYSWRQIAIRLDVSDATARRLHAAGPDSHCTAGLAKRAAAFADQVMASV